MKPLGFFPALILAAAALFGLTAPLWGGQATPMSLTDKDKDLLLRVARESILAHLEDREPPAVTDASPVMCEKRGAFVSLHRRGQLRGCIGFIEAVKPLLQTIREMAPAAAFHDPRFRPLSKNELADLEIEISVLTPLQLIKSVDEIQVGKHGLYMVQGFCRGLLLPQVATEYKWDRTTFLQQTCCKAGLPPDAWKDQATKIYIFAADIFGDASGCSHQELKSP
jgi:uncharacterized protein